MVAMIAKYQDDSTLSGGMAFEGGDLRALGALDRGVQSGLSLRGRASFFAVVIDTSALISLLLDEPPALPRRETWAVQVWRLRGKHSRNNGKPCHHL